MRFLTIAVPTINGTITLKNSINELFILKE